MKFSITIPAYKRAYLKEAIESCLSQTYKDFELVIVNDASPEDLDSVVACFSDPRIRYYTNEKNCGAVDVVDNWNICLGYATGDYIICMGDDDRLLPCCLDEYRKLIEKYPGLDVYHGHTEIIDEKGKFRDVTAMRPEYEGVWSMIWHRWNGRAQFIGDFLFDVSTLRSKGGFIKFPLAWSSDDVTAVMCAKDMGVANTQVPVFQYRVNSLTISKTGNAEKKIEALKLEREWFVLFFNESLGLGHMEENYRSACVKCFAKHTNKLLALAIASDMKGKSVFLDLFRLVYWIIRARQLNVPIKVVCFAFVQAKKSIN